MRPLCLGASGSVRATSMPRSARWASVFHTFCPVMTHSSPSRTARHARPARSEPAPGSLKSWHQESSPVNMGRSSRFFSASSPWVTMVGPAMVRPKKCRASGEPAPASRSAASMSFWMLGGRPRPPQPSGKCTHARPRSYWRPRTSVRLGRAGVDLVEELGEPFLHELGGIGGHGGASSGDDGGQGSTVPQRLDPRVEIPRTLRPCLPEPPAGPRSSSTPPPTCDPAATA